MLILIFTQFSSLVKPQHASNARRLRARRAPLRLHARKLIFDQQAYADFGMPGFLVLRDGEFRAGILIEPRIQLLGPT